MSHSIAMNSVSKGPFEMRATSLLRVISVVLGGVGLCMVLWAELWLGHGGFVRLAIPLGGQEGLPLPLAYWAGVALYAAWYGRRFHLPRAVWWRRALWLGVGLHLLGLLANLAWYVAGDMWVTLTSAYRSYWHLVWGAVLSLGGCGISWWIARWRLARAVDPWLFFLPLLGGYLAMWSGAAVMPHAVTVGAATAGLALLAGARIVNVRAWGARLRRVAGNERVFLLVVAVVALALRLFYTMRVMEDPNFVATGSDGETFDTLAWALVDGKPAESVPWWSTQLFCPGYVRFVALLYWLGGRNYFLVCAVQSLLGTMACLLLYDVAKRLAGQRVARIAALFGAVNYPMVFAAAALGHQALDLFLTLLVVWGLVRYAEHPLRRGLWLAGIGLVLGYAAATREGNAVLWLFLLGWFLVGVRHRVGWRTALRHATALTGGFLATFVPFALTASTEGFVARFALQWFYEPHTLPHLNQWFNPWRDPASAWVVLHDQPLRVVAELVKGMAANFSALFFNQSYGAFDPVFLVRSSPYYYGMWGYAYLLTGAGFALVVWQTCRRTVERLAWWLILGLLASRTLVHLFFQSAYRHRTPLEPFLILLAAYGLTRLLSAARLQVSGRRVEAVGTVSEAMVLRVANVVS